MAVRKTKQDRAPASTFQTRAGASLWTLEKNGRSIECAVSVDASRGVELEIRRDGERCAGRRFNELEEAVAHANALQSDLRATGWQVI
jgi:hypothetical protein